MVPFTKFDIPRELTVTAFPCDEFSISEQCSLPCLYGVVLRIMTTEGQRSPRREIYLCVLLRKEARTDRNIFALRFATNRVVAGPPPTTTPRLQGAVACFYVGLVGVPKHSSSSRRQFGKMELPRTTSYRNCLKQDCLSVL